MSRSDNPGVRQFVGEASAKLLEVGNQLDPGVVTLLQSRQRAIARPKQLLHPRLPSRVHPQGIPRDVDG